MYIKSFFNDLNLTKKDGIYLLALTVFSILYTVHLIDVNYILTHTSSRQNLVKQLVAQAYQYSLDGLNIDFESLKEEEIGDA